MTTAALRSLLPINDSCGCPGLARALARQGISFLCECLCGRQPPSEARTQTLKLWPADVSRLAAGLFILVLSLPKVTQPLAKNKNKDQPTASQALIINFGEEQP